MSYYLIGSNSCSLELRPGHYSYPFNFVLPPNLPSSFEGAHGKVRYAVKAVVDRAWKLDYKVITLFTVVSVLDLNMDFAATVR
jgi:hypothetical protein